MFQLIETVGEITRPLVLTEDDDFDPIVRYLDEHDFHLIGSNLLGHRVYSGPDGRKGVLRTTDQDEARTTVDAERQTQRKVCSHCGSASFHWGRDWSGVYCRLCSQNYVGIPSGRPAAFWEATYKLAAHRETLRTV